MYTLTVNILLYVYIVSGRIQGMYQYKKIVKVVHVITCREVCYQAQVYERS